MNKDTDAVVPPSSGEARRENEEKNEENDSGAGLIGQVARPLAETEPRPTYKGANGIYVFSQRVRDAVVVAYQMADHDLSNQDAASWLMSAIYDVAIAAHEEMAPPPRPQPPETLEAESMYSPTSGYPAPLPDRGGTAPRLNERLREMKCKAVRARGLQFKAAPHARRAVSLSRL